MWHRLKLAWKVLWEEENLLEEYEATGLSAELMRALLGSVSFDDIKNRPPMTAEERRIYEQTVAAFYPHVIEPAINRLIGAQEQLMGRGSAEQREIGIVDPKDQVLFCRGTMNGIELVKEEFKEAFEAHIAYLQVRNEKFDKHKLFPEIFPLEEERS